MEAMNMLKMNSWRFPILPEVFENTQKRVISGLPVSNPLPFLENPIKFIETVKELPKTATKAFEG